MILLVLMFYGGCQCSTTGGIKVVRLLIAMKYIGREIKKYIHPTSVSTIRINKHPVPELVILNVMGFFMLYFIVFIVSALFLAACGYDIVSSITAAAALLGNVGPAMGIFGPLYNYAELPNVLKTYLSLVMITGRLEIYPMLVLFLALARK
jgi:trk system potassium uptake protein TrkH